MTLQPCTGEYLVKQKAIMPRKPPVGKNKVIDVLAPLSDVDHILRNELCDLRSDAYTFLSYGYAVHELNSLPDLFDEPATLEAFINQVRHQLSLCAEMSGSVMDQTKLDQDPTRLAEIADVLLSIYQCERRTFRYMAHVMLAAQQSHKMKQVIAEMDTSTAYLVFDFKQTFLAKGFREGGDSYYGEKECYGVELVCTPSQTVKMPGSMSLPTKSMWKWISQQI
eukprot:Em0010g48a